MSDEAVWAELDAYATRLEPKLRDAFQRAVAHLKTGASPELLAEVVRTNNPELLLQHLDLSEFQALLREAVVGGAQRIPGLLSVNFNLFNPAVSTALRQSELKLVQNVSAELRAGVLHHLELGLRGGVHPTTTAIQLRPLVGMAPKDVQAVHNYRKLLSGGAKGQPLKEALRRNTRDKRFDRSILRAAEAKSALTPDAIETHVKRFEEKLLKQRAETVARTESITALWKGGHLKWQQAIQEGKVQAHELRRFWHVAKDERVCPMCKPIPELNPEGVAFHEPFVMPDGSTIMGPAAHPNCRCVIFIRMVLDGLLG
jgi:hypothetical protein